MDPETFGGNLPSLIDQFVRGLPDEPAAAELDAWTRGPPRRSTRAASTSSRFTQFCFTATRQD